MSRVLVLAAILAALPWASQSHPGAIAASSGAPRERVAPYRALRPAMTETLPVPPRQLLVEFVASRPPSTPGISGRATWYRWKPGEAAAGPALRAFLGAGWRLMTVRVCTAISCVSVRLTDWCACSGERIIDLDRASFAQLTAPSRGLVKVTVAPA